jgi:hypothetical protein
MTKEDIIRMARDSGMELYGLAKDREKFVHYLQEFAALVAAAERESCAKVCDDLPPPDGYNMTEISFWDVTSLECAAAIRARGQA